jgi:hypothetical protein
MEMEACCQLQASATGERWQRKFVELIFGPAFHQHKISKNIGVMFWPPGEAVHVCVSHGRVSLA